MLKWGPRVWKVLSVLGSSALTAMLFVYFMGEELKNQKNRPIEDGFNGSYERIIETGILRCGYIVYPPEVKLDTNTGKLSGWVVDTVEAIGKELDIKIDWVEQVTHDTMFAGLKHNHYDALCSGLWESPKRSKHALFMQPVTYASYYPYVRAKDKRFDSDLNRINQTDIKIAVADGEVVANEQFPRAGQHHLASGSAYSLIFEEVASRKADVVFAMPSTVAPYMRNNPGVLRSINQPVLVMPSSVMSVNVGEHRLKHLIDSTLRHLQNTGAIDMALNRYIDKDDPTYYRVAKPYQTRQSKYLLSQSNHAANKTLNTAQTDYQQ